MSPLGLMSLMGPMGLMGLMGFLLHSSISRGGDGPELGLHGLINVQSIDEMGNFYDQVVTVHFIARLRSERQFPSAEALALQIQQDKEQAIKLLNHDY